jgi:ribosomal protein S13
MILFGKHCPNHFTIKKAFQNIYGIGNKRADFICKELGVNSKTKIKDLILYNKKIEIKVLLERAIIESLTPRSDSFKNKKKQSKLEGPLGHNKANISEQKLNNRILNFLKDFSQSQFIYKEQQKVNDIKNITLGKLADIKNNTQNKNFNYMLIRPINFEANLIKDKKDAIAALRKIRSYRGLRLAKGLPVRGQRTKTNAKTARKRLNI